MRSEPDSNANSDAYGYPKSYPNAWDSPNTDTNSVWTWLRSKPNSYPNFERNSDADTHSNSCAFFTYTDADSYPNANNPQAATTGLKNTSSTNAIGYT